MQSEINCAAQIHRRPCAAVYGNTVTSDDLVFDWCRRFENRRTDVQNEVDQGRKSIMTENVVHQVDQFVRENRRLTISDFQQDFPKFLHRTERRIVSENLV